MRLLVILFSLLVSSQAFGQARVVKLGTLLDEVAMNGAAATRTFYIGLRHDCGTNNSCAPTSSTDTSEGEPISSFDSIRLELDYTHSQNGAITLTCTDGATRATADHSIPNSTESAGTYTLAWSGVVVTPTLSGNTNWSIKFRTRGASVIKCVASHGGTPDANDVLSVVGYAVEN